MEDPSVLHSMNLNGVRLTGGMFAAQLAGARDYYIGINSDDLLWGFRTRAGKPTPGSRLMGWYGAGVYHVFGQILSGLVRLSRATGDPKPAEKALYLLEGWAECMESDGYGFQNSRDKAHDPYYEYDKLVCGLTDCIEHLDSDLARSSLSRLTDWALSNLNRTANQQKEDDPPGTEWYTLSENLYRAFVLTGDEKYQDFAAVWEYPQNWDKYLNPETFRSLPKHAYSHVNTLSGAAMAYRVHGDERYLKIITNAYDVLTTNYIYATGGYGPCERLFKDPGYLGESVLHAQDDAWGHMEVSCSSWAVFKLCRYLMEFTGDAKYADWAEKILYNCLGAELLPRPGGKIMYYSDYYVLGSRKSCDDGRTTSAGATFEWPCCTGTFPQAMAEYANLVSFVGEKGLHLSQYLPCQIDWTQSGTPITATVTTSYPADEAVRIDVQPANPVAFTLSVRRPAWATSIDVRVNQEKVAASEKNGWIGIDRTWQPNDTVGIRIPSKLRFQAVDSEHPGIVALLSGPVVLASDMSGIMAGDVGNPDSWIERVEKEALSYATLPGNLKTYPGRQKRFKPYFAYKEGETAYVYNRIEQAE